MFNKILNIVWSQIEQTGMRNDESHCWIHTRFVNGFSFYVISGKAFFPSSYSYLNYFPKDMTFEMIRRKKKVTQMKLFSNFIAPHLNLMAVFFILYFLHYLLVLLLLINLIKRKVNWKLRNILSKLILNWIKFMFKWKKGWKHYIIK